MKNTKISFRLILAALAATMALTACTKEPAPGKVDTDPKASQSEGSRIIAVSFGNATKTDFSITDDGIIAPSFKKGDKIVLCSDIENPTDDNTQICEVDVDDETEVATITTKLTGDLTAYYPATLAISGEKGLNIYVPSVQDGTFAKANICSATITENAASATFTNEYALFVITPPEGTKKLTIKSLRPIGDDGQRSDPKRNLICGTGDDLYKITVGDGTNAIPSPCYVAMNEDVNLSDLSFEATSDAEGTTGHIKGITTSAIAATAGTDVAVGSEAYNGRNAVAAGSAYTIDENNWHEYVTVAGRKWATMNIGAESPEAYGRYFAWGDVIGQEADLTIETVKNEKINAFDQGFSVAPTLEPDPAILPLKYDAANANWGGAWRIPTKKEYENLITSKSGEFASGLYFGTSPNQIFLPAAGGGEDHNLAYMEEIGNYLSSNLNIESTGCFYGITFTDDGVILNGEYPRAWGLSIRAIVDDPDAIEDTPAVAIPGKFSVNADGGQVMFSSGNLTYNVTSKKWSFYANQYDCATEYDANLLSYFNWGYNATQSIIPNAEYSDNVNRSSGNLSQGEDWGSQIGDGNTWHTPTQAEWKYILETRTNAAEKVGYAKVGTVCGIVILPDDFTLPSSCTFNPKATTGWDANTYTTGDSGTWKDMEEAGAVFLPAAGNLSSATIGQWGEYGRYWSSSVSDYVSSSSYYLMFRNTGIDCTEYDSRLNSYSVRLVKNCPQAQK